MNRINTYFIFIISILLFTSCNDEMENEMSNNDEIEKTNSILGKKLENPYSVTNMKIALENLKSNNKNLNKGEIEASHLYIKFKPKNEDDITLLKRDSTLNLFDYPMDYVAIEGQDNYRDPKVSKDEPTYQYASVKIDYRLPDIEYEVLEELFIPEEIESKKNDEFYTEILVDEALKITNNFELDESNNGNVQMRRSKWRPAGRIRMWDNSLNRYVAPEGLKVRAKKWFTTHTGFVNSAGYYSCNGRFRGKARYRIDWERHHFALRSGYWASAQYRGPYKRGNWDWNIQTSSRHNYFGTIFRAAFHYYYQNIQGLRRPPLNTPWHSQLRIRAHNSLYTDFWGNPSTTMHGSQHNGRNWGINSNVHIYNPWRSSLSIYGTTIHELAHASHWRINKNGYKNGNLNFVESWANGVSDVLTRMVYTNTIIDNDIYLIYSSTYTGIIYDMVDGLDIDNGDNVSNYTIRQLEDTLVNSRSLQEYIINLENNYNNGTGTTNNLETLLNYWLTYP